MGGSDYWLEVVKRHGYTSIRSWAKQSGHNPQTVYTAIAAWGKRDDRTPHGGINRTIMAELRALEDQHAA